MNVRADGAVNVEGPKGKLAWTLPKQITGEGRRQPTFHSIAAAKTARCARCTAFPARWSTTWSRGVSEGFMKDLEIQGVGFKAAVKGSHPRI